MQENEKETTLKDKNILKTKKKKGKVLILIGLVLVAVLILGLVFYSKIKIKKDSFSSDFLVQGEGKEKGTVIDTRNGLMWVRDPLSNPGGAINEKVNWQEAKKRCEDLDFAGHKDWRLPTIKELISIIDYSKVNPAIDKEIFPNTHSLPYWSSTEYANNSIPAWAVHFSTGLVFNTSKEDTAYFRCVRDIK